MNEAFPKTSFSQEESNDEDTTRDRAQNRNRRNKPSVRANEATNGGRRAWNDISEYALRFHSNMHEQNNVVGWVKYVREAGPSILHGDGDGDEDGGMWSGATTTNESEKDAE